MIPRPPEGLEGQVQYITHERTQVIQRLALESKKAKGVPDSTLEPAKSLVKRLDAFLDTLDSIKMTTDLRARSRADEGLALMFKNNAFHFSPEHSQKARGIYEKWEAQGLESAAELKKQRAKVRAERRNSSSSSDDNNNDSPAAEPPSSTTSFKPVPPSHRIWGTEGIMHGLARKNGKRKTTILNPSLEREKRPSAVQGHNSIPVGTWFPFQLSALFHGAHGSSQAGIHYGEGGEAGGGGAYSIVVAAMYDDLDNDRGETLWYSGSHSHDNEDPLRIPERSRGTMALHRSLENGKGVRVLRSASGKSRYAPARGIRYDGLYRVVACRRKVNAKGGLYEQFELQREPGQVSLEECRKRPSGREIRDFDSVERGY